MKHHKHFRQTAAIITLVIFLQAVPLPFAAYGQNDSPAHIPPLAAEGVIDLSAYKGSELKNINLNGQWEFYWQELLTPQELESTAAALSIHPRVLE